MSLPAHLTLRIVTPDRPILEEEVDEVEVPGADGYFGVLPGHTPMLASLQVGELWYRKGAEKHYLSIAFGFAEVMPAQVTILARIAERAEEIDVERAEAERQRAEAHLGKQVPAGDFERARISMMKALVRLQVATRARTRG
ncbi:MAG: atpC [Acidobacteria bacterium]|nr:atpC [Acidobacteriota bacterium]